MRASSIVAAFVLFGLVSAAGGTAVRSTRQPSQQPQQPQQPGGRSGNDTLPPVPPGCVRIGHNDICQDPEPVVAARLIADGPRAGGAGAPLTSVQGFVRSGWPVVVDFEPQPGSVTEVSISVYQSTRIINLVSARLTMDPTGQGGRQLFKGVIELPASELSGDGHAVGIATYTVSSRKLDSNGKPMRHPLPVTVFGIGAGPRAVGSISLTDVTLADGATSLHLPPSKRVSIDYHFLLKQEFDLVAEDVWRRCHGFLCSGVDHQAKSAHRRGPQAGGWEVKRTGAYRLDVRAWLSCGTSDFKQCGDDAAWATGQSQTVVVE